MPGSTPSWARAEIDALARKGVPVSSASLRGLITRLGIPASMPRSEAEERLHAYSPEIVDWVREQIALRCRETGSVPAVLTLDNVVARPGSAEYALEPAQKRGFLLMDMLQLFEGHDLAALRVADWDNHPNARANRMVADLLYEEICEQGLRQRFGRADGQPAAMAGI